MKKRIRNIQSLEKEIGRSRHRLKEIEGSFDDNVIFFKENYGKMTMNSVFGSKSTAGFWARIGEKLLESEKIKDSISNLVDKLTSKFH
ncbi:MAG: hypothetical protein ACO29O_02045 [Chitinophagaceae bacterium]